MIELTQQQAQQLSKVHKAPPRVVNPVTQEAFVLLRAEEYERLLEYDASPWTEEEMDMLAAEAADLLGWEGMEAYQDDAK
jgi:hypothetical protein